MKISNSPVGLWFMGTNTSGKCNKKNRNCSYPALSTQKRKKLNSSNKEKNDKEVVENYYYCSKSEKRRK